MDMLRGGFMPGLLGNRVSAAAPPDVTAPSAITFSPVDNATGVSLSTNLTVLFDEDVVLGAGTITLKRTSDNVTIEAWDVATEAGTGAGQVNVVGGRILTMRLTSNLAVTTEHYVIWDAGVVKDAANNSVAASASTTLWSFTTGSGADVTAPTVSSFLPLDNATGVAITANLVATFNETVTLGASGTITLKRTSDNATIEAWDVATEGGSTAGKVEVVGGTALTMHLTSSLANSIEYYVIWDAGVVKDTSNNNVAAQASTTAWSFTTTATSAYDSASDAIFAAFITPPTTGRKDLIDTCVLALKAAGVWTKLDTLYLFAAADSQAAKINWIAPNTFDATEVNAPSFTADRGFTGAATKYLDTGFNPTTATTPKYVQNSASGFGWSLTSASTVGGMIGTNGTAGGVGDMTIYPHLSGVAYFLINQSSNSSVASADGSGLMSVNRSAAGATQLYRNATSIGTDTIASQAPVNASRTFFKRGADAIWTGQCAAGGFGQSLDAIEQTALHSALRAYLSGVGAVYQAETDAIAAAFTTPPTTARKNLIDAAVVSLKSAGVWTKLDALYAFAAADSQAAKVNWKAPGTFNATEVNAPSFTADLGFTGNGTTSYLDSGFNPSTATTPNFVQNSASVFAWSNTNIAVIGAIVGYVTSTSTNIVPRNATDNYNHIINDTSNTGTANTNSTGLYTAVRTGASAHEAYKNGVSAVTGVLASVAVPNETMVFLRRTSGFWGGQVVAGGFGSQLSAAEQLALYNALRTYLTAVGVP